MTQEQSARLLPQKPSGWAKILLNRKVPIFLFFLLELAFLVISYLSLQEHFPSIILWEHLLSVFTFFYLLNRSMDSRSKLSWVIIIALFPIFGTALLYFSLADLGVRRLKKRLEDATVQASDYLSTDPEVADYLSQSDRQLQKLAYFLEHSPAQFPIYSNTEVTYFPLGDDMVPSLLEDLNMEHYLQEKPQKREGQGLVLPYGNSPLTYHKVAEDVYLHLLNTSTDYVHIMTPYLILDDELVRAMTFAARRGVDVRIIMPGIPDKQYAFDIATTYFKSLLDAGVRIFRYTPGFVHAKVYVSDSQQAVVGTINTDYRSLYQNFEDGVFLYKNLEVLHIEQDFERTQALSEEVTLESLSKIPMAHRLGGYLFSLIGPLM